MNLYHYTDLNAVHSILSTHKIRMTDIRFLNDKTEYLQGINILRDAAADIFSGENNYYPGFVGTVAEWFPQIFNELENFQYTDEIMYIASFSRSEDTLSQWRSYGMFAIGLDEGLLSEELSFNKIERIKCYYVFDLNDAIKMAKDLLHEHALNFINSLWLLVDPQNRNSTLYDDLKEIVSLLATTFKHPCFSEENEIRLVKKSEADAEDIKFRVKNNLLIPFFELELSPEVFTCIRIGPLENQELVEQTLDIFVSHRQAKLYSEGVNIEYSMVVESSDIPYRTL
ncbi:hypothetical protein F4826_004915 [Rahnella inusitata]|nr:hypothetical protein [Rahnella inusitata]